MNLIKERRKRGAVCPKCKHPDYTMQPPIIGETLKPEFRCKACGNSWAYGYDGGKYAELANHVQNGIIMNTPENKSANNVAQEIARQIGARAFYMMGTKNKLADNDNNALIFDVKGAKDHIKKIVVRLNSMDLYDVEFWNIPTVNQIIQGKMPVKVCEETDIYSDRLKDCIEEHTGLYLSL